MISELLPAVPVGDLDEYRQDGGFTGLRAARDTAPDDVIDLIGRAGIRGRGGAGFPAARKWAGVRASSADDDAVTIVVNAAEGEPGTFKDRALIRTNPYLVLEGALIAAHCIGSTTVVVATKAKYGEQVARLSQAIDELREADHLQGVDIRLVLGPDHYLFGEETALLEVIEGDDPLPRQIPPYLYGLYTTRPQLGWSAGAQTHTTDFSSAANNPALVNNAETYAHVALVLRLGVDWYRSMGTDDSPGPTIVTICGDVLHPAVAAVPMGRPVGELIDELGGGLRAGRTTKGVLSGVANPVLTAAHIDAPLTYEGMAAGGSGLGSAGLIVYDDTRNMVDVALQVSMFLHVESCGQCNSCKLGTHDVTALLEQLVAGSAPGGVLPSLRRSLAGVTDSSRCYLPTQEQRLVASLLDDFPDDLATRIAGIPGDDAVPLPRLVDIRSGHAELVAEPPFKAPDWTLQSTPVRLTKGRHADRSGV